MPNPQYPILGYIKYSMKNRYIYFSKRKDYAIQYTADLSENEQKLSVPDGSVEIEQNAFLNDALKILTNRQRVIVELKYFYAFSDMEISRLLSISRQSVNRLKTRALKLLRKYFLDNGMP